MSVSQFSALLLPNRNVSRGRLRVNYLAISVLISCCVLMIRNLWQTGKGEKWGEGVDGGATPFWPPLSQRLLLRRRQLLLLLLLHRIFLFIVNCPFFYLTDKAFALITSYQFLSAISCSITIQTLKNTLDIALVAFHSYVLHFYWLIGLSVINPLSLINFF